MTAAEQRKLLVTLICQELDSIQDINTLDLVWRIAHNFGKEEKQSKVS